jgi:hypothetical protein
VASEPRSVRTRRRTTRPRPVPVPPSGRGADSPGETGDWSRTIERLTAAAGIIAPTTIITALLYYYGYVASYARFDSFGVDISTLQLSTQELLLESVEVIYVPCAVLLAALVAVLVIRARTRSALAAPAPHPWLRRAGWAALILGVLALGRAAYGVFVPAVAMVEVPPATTPFCLGAGAALAMYGRELLIATSRGADQDRPPETGVRLLVAGIVVLSLFWMANTFASAYGRSQTEAGRWSPAERPAVTLDTEEQLYLNAACAELTTLPQDTDQRYRYRYRGLRLLAVGGERLFLVPERWRDGCPVVVLPYDSVRVQFSP